MSERLTVSLEDGIPEKLRELAGGQRKVGAYLSDVVSWLWRHKEILASEDGFRDLFVARRLELDDLPQTALREIQENFEARTAETAALVAQAQTLMAEFQTRLEALEASSPEAAKMAEVFRAKLGAPQQDSSDNDA